MKEVIIKILLIAIALCFHLLRRNRPLGVPAKQRIGRKDTEVTRCVIPQKLGLCNEDGHFARIENNRTKEGG